MEISKKIGIRIICFLVSVLCLLVLILPASAALQNPMHVRSMASVVYRSASADALVIGQIKDGESLSVLGSVGEYYQIDCFGVIGYIHKNQIHYSLEDGYTVRCNPKHPDTERLSLLAPGEVLTLRKSILSMGEDFLGVPYVYGGKSPWGFDCSGFVSYVYEKHDFSLHRCADEQMQDGLIVAREDLRPGDLVFFSIYGPWLASHVGIYIGNGQMVHAGSGGICIASLNSDYWTRSYVGARRLIIGEPRMLEPRNPLDVDSVLR